MKFPSLKTLAKSFTGVVKRFPFEMLFTFVGTVAAIVRIENSYYAPDPENWSLRVLLTANLGLLLSLAATLFTENKKIVHGRKLLLRLLAFMIAVAFFLIINPYKREADTVRFVLISLALHLLVAFAAFTSADNIQGFWQFNKVLFLRFLTSALYSVVLFAGLAAAMGAMNFLFNFKFESDSFEILWVCIAGVFNTAFFLSGVPADFAALNADESYPKGLKIFTQYVLIPLATVYVVILLAYEIKILLEWNLPKGNVSNLILGYAVFGMLSLLLVYPIRNWDENKWIKTYTRSFYFLLLPLIVLLWLAAGKRLFRYGVTEYRYFLVLLAFWLLFIALYFLLSRKQNIKVIPISLCLLTLATVYGPQSAFNVTFYSQRNILINLFKRHHAFANNKLLPVDSNKVGVKDASRMVAELDYLERYYGVYSLQPYLVPNLDTLKYHPDKKAGTDRWESRYARLSYKQDWVQKYLHLGRFTAYETYTDTAATVAQPNSYNLKAKSNALINVKGFDYLFEIGFDRGDTIEYSSGALHVTQFKGAKGVHLLNLNGEIIRFDAGSFLQQLMNNKQKIARYSDKNVVINEYTLPAEMLSLTQSSRNYTVTMQIYSASFAYSGHKVSQVDELNISYFIKRKS